MYEQISSNIWRSRMLMVAFILFVVLIGFVFYLAMGDPIAVALAVIIALATTVGSFYHSDKLVLAVTHARPATGDEFAPYVNSVDGLAIAAGLPRPRPYVIDDPSPNAFATGRDPDHAVICVTTGLLKVMNRVELEGVIAHEMAHIKNYDIRFMMLVAVLVGSVALMANFFWWNARWGRSRGRSRGGGQGQAIYFAIGIVLAILAPISAAIAQAAISRRREYLADSSGALLTRYPDGLASALEKIGADPNKLQGAGKATAHLFIANPLKVRTGRANRLFSTHPPIEERVRRLREM